VDIEPILAAAQIVTGIATLIVASVLIWQMILQRKSLETAHRDNEQNLSFESLNLTDKLMAVRMEKDFSRIWTQRHNSENDLNTEDFEKLNHYYLRWFTVMNTEWRMGRLTNESDMFYYKRKLWAVLNSQCGQQFYVREGRNFIRYERLRKIGDEIYTEQSGKLATM